MLVTGASGFVGQHLVRGPASQGWEIIAPSSRSMDVTDRASVLDTITGWKPDVVVHLAYRKDRRTVVDGTRNVAEAAVAARSRLVHISTDALFAGRPHPYVETDRPDPVFDYGRDKADAERIVTDLAPTAAIIRTSLVYGTDRLDPAQQQLREMLSSGRSPMTYFTDEFRTPVHADDLAAAVSKVAAQFDVGGVLHVAGPDPVSRADLARSMARHLGVPSARLATTTLAESGLIRPGNVVLDTSLAASLGITCRRIVDTLG